MISSMRRWPASPIPASFARPRTMMMTRSGSAFRFSPCRPFRHERSVRQSLRGLFQALSHQRGKAPSLCDIDGQRVQCLSSTFDRRGGQTRTPFPSPGFNEWIFIKPKLCHRTALGRQSSRRDAALTRIGSMELFWFDASLEFDRRVRESPHRKEQPACPPQRCEPSPPPTRVPDALLKNRRPSALNTLEFAHSFPRRSAPLKRRSRLGSHAAQRPPWQIRR